MNWPVKIVEPLHPPKGTTVEKIRKAIEELKT